MKSSRNLSAAGALLATALLLALAPSARATTFPDLVYDVTLNVAPLSLDPNQPFSLDLQLITAAGNQTNTVTLSQFQFSGGSAFGAPTFVNGNVSGSLATSLVLTSTSNPNTATDNEFAQAFTPGTTQISFVVDQSPNSETVGSGTPIPEQFNVAVLDTGLNNVPTTDPSGGNALVTSPLGSTSTLATVNTFVTVGPDAGVFAVVAAPEPNSAFLGFIAAGLMFGLLRRRFNRAA